MSRKLTRSASDGLLSKQPISFGSDGVRLPTFSTPSSTLLCCILSKSLPKWYAASPMDSFHGDPSPSDPKESVNRNFLPPPLLYFAVYFLRLSRTDTRRVRLPTFSTPFTTLLCSIFSHELTRGESDILLPRQPVSIESDGVRPFADMYFHPVRDFSFSHELTSSESDCSWPLSIGLSLGVLNNPPNCCCFPGSLGI